MEIGRRAERLAYLEMRLRHALMFIAMGPIVTMVRSHAWVGEVVCARRLPPPEYVIPLTYFGQGCFFGQRFITVGLHGGVHLFKVHRHSQN